MQRDEPSIGICRDERSIGICCRGKRSERVVREAQMQARGPSPRSLCLWRALWFVPSLALTEEPRRRSEHEAADALNAVVHHPSLRRDD